MNAAIRFCVIAVSSKAKRLERFERLERLEPVGLIGASVVDHCLTHIPEMADVVHDLLGFLARQMVEMNRQKQDESKGFLDWLEATIGVKVDTLKNKTKLAAYYDGTLEELLDVLKENKKVLKINPASKEFFDPVKDAFEKSLAKLSPLKRKVATTDRLIDLIVYRLYGLTDEEIKQVEGEALSVT